MSQQKAKSIFLFPNGAVAVLDEAGQQIVEWQRNLFCDHLRAMREAGVVASDTPIVSATGGKQTVADWIGRHDS